MPGSPSLELLIARSKISAFTNFAMPSVFSQFFCHFLPVLDILTYAIDARVYGRNRLGGCVNELILNLMIEGFISKVRQFDVRFWEKCLVWKVRSSVMRKCSASILAELCMLKVRTLDDVRLMNPSSISAS